MAASLVIFVARMNISLFIKVQNCVLSKWLYMSFIYVDCQACIGCHVWSTRSNLLWTCVFTVLVLGATLIWRYLDPNWGLQGRAWLRRALQTNIHHSSKNNKGCALVGTKTSNNDSESNITMTTTLIVCIPCSPLTVFV